MIAVPERDRLGATTIVYDPKTMRWAHSLADLVALAPDLARDGHDRLGYRAALGFVRDDERTMLRAVKQKPPSKSAPRADIDPDAALVAAAGAMLDGKKRIVVTIGGGIDGPIAVLAARRAGFVVRDALHLAIPGTDYDERDGARLVANALGLDLYVLEAKAAELAEALPRVVELSGTVLYNLHPVSRLLVASKARSLGADVLVSGDGADQAARGAAEAPDYVPIVAACTRGAGLALASPFFADDVVDSIVALGDPSKARLRALAVKWGLPSDIVMRPKKRSWAPPIPRSATARQGAWSPDDRENVAAASFTAWMDRFGEGRA